ncbi:unnamed protein product [Meloidogyne enterolobii]|uniref:Uncharacterized protein n=1 Tax=Meloidogyne enterolobii TaxID=390850 RepID=A0ACB0Y6H5_MELEN
MYTSLIPPQNLSIEPSRTSQESEIENNTVTNFCVQNSPFEPNPDFCTLEGISVTDLPPTPPVENFVKVKEYSPPLQYPPHLPSINPNTGP